MKIIIQHCKPAIIKNKNHYINLKKKEVKYTHETYMM